MSNDMLALAERLAGSLGPFNFVTSAEKDMVVSALRASAGGRPDREAVARVIDSWPWTFEPWNDNWRAVVADRKAEALEKADAILSLHPVGPSDKDVQTKFAESESTTHRESLTKSGVKSLVWSENFSSNEHCPYDHCMAETPLGSYQVEWKSWKQYDSYVLYLDGEYVDALDTLDDAKAAAQKNFAETIAKCLDVLLSTDASACPGSRFLRSSLNQSIIPHTIDMPKYEYQTEDNRTGRLNALAPDASAGATDGDCPVCSGEGSIEVDDGDYTTCKPCGGSGKQTPTPPSAGDGLPKPIGWVVNMTTRGDGIFMSAAEYDECSAAAEADTHDQGYFAVYTHPQPEPEGHPCLCFDEVSRRLCLKKADCTPIAEAQDATKAKGAS